MELTKESSFMKLAIDALRQTQMSVNTELGQPQPSRSKLNSFDMSAQWH
jgi:hypothetical protein